MKKEKYEMFLGEESRYSEVWIICPTDGNYIYDAVCKLPAGSEVNKIAAQKVLDAMNG